MRDKLAKLIFDCWLDRTADADGRAPTAAQYADYLISHGVTFADVPDTNVGKWIPVSERLPKESGRYWVWLKFHVRDRVLECPDVQRFVAELNAFMADGIQSIDVTHWMPIVPPKEGGT
jgi:hypothetical protein